MVKQFIQDGFRNGNRLTNTILVIAVPILIFFLTIIYNKLDNINTLTIQHEEQIKGLHSMDSKIAEQLTELKNDIKKHLGL